MNKFEGWINELRQGVTPLFASMSTIATDVYNSIKSSPPASALKSAIASGKVKLEEAEEYIRQMEKKARHDQPLQDERVIWDALTQVVKEDFYNCPDEFFESLSQIKDSPQIAAVAKQILAERKAAKPTIKMEPELEEVFLKFTDRSKRIVKLAERCARMMEHNFIAAPHLMIAVIQEGTGIGAHVMKSLKVDVEQLIAATKQQMSGIEDSKPDQPVRITNIANAILVNAGDEAKKFNSNKIGTEHILLALCNSCDNRPAGSQDMMLNALKVTAAQIRGEVNELLAITTSPAPSTPTPKLTADDIKAITESIIRVDKREGFALVIVGKDKPLTSHFEVEQMDKVAEMLKEEIGNAVTAYLKSKGLMA